MAEELSPRVNAARLLSRRSLAWLSTSAFTLVSGSAVLAGLDAGAAATFGMATTVRADSSRSFTETWRMTAVG